MRLLVITLGLATALGAPAQDTANWPQFLGPGSLARASGASTLDFDLERDLRYRIEVPAGDSSPCIWGGQIFLTGQDGAKLVMLALDRQTGKEQWRFGVPAPEESKFDHADVSLVMPTACTNGKRVIFYLPSWGLVARKLDGTLAWQKRLPDPKPRFGIGSSPMIWQGMVILLRDGCPDAALYALNEESGKEIWQVRRRAFRSSHTTPFLWQNKERVELIIASTGSVVSYEPRSGSELWRVEGLTPLVCTTPTASAERLYFAGWSTPAAAGVDRVLDGMQEQIELTEKERKDPAALFQRFDTNGDGKLTPAEAPAGRPREAFGFLDRDHDGAISLAEWIPLMRMPVMGKNVLVAIEPGGEGNVTDTHVAWSVRRGIPYVSSPLLDDGRIYLVKAGGILSCFDAATGQPKFKRIRLDDHSEYYATPVGIDGHLIVCSSGGTLYVLHVADGLKVVRTLELNERIFATPAVVDGTIYLRTRTALYAFGR